jgi:hypothetical protein
VQLLVGFALTWGVGTVLTNRWKTLDEMQAQRLAAESARQSTLAQVRTDLFRYTALQLQALGAMRLAVSRQAPREEVAQYRTQLETIWFDTDVLSAGMTESLRRVIRGRFGLKLGTFWNPLTTAFSLLGDYFDKARQILTDRETEVYFSTVRGNARPREPRADWQRSVDDWLWRASECSGGLSEVISKLETADWVANPLESSEIVEPLSQCSFSRTLPREESK